ncbi:TIGR03617 family F420-dependent LLM class oxidoreductase [Noviherbaspirillum sedimenti]|nr:TIGR03617 family F420-dependent LLM class oxidoreductase [Noviherbaspirillum sedimenti]
MKVIARIREPSDDEPDQWVSGPFFERVIQETKLLEEAGFDAIATTESSHDPFVGAMLAAEHSKRAEIWTHIAVAFARNPMNVAYLAHDLQAFSQGRFVLGIGSQVQAHVVKRFSMPWSSPAARMKEFVLALRAIWDCWNNGTRLEFRGEFYSHTLMTPVFMPPPNPSGPPPIMMGAVGPKMTEVAAEVADGIIGHSFASADYMREVSLPVIEKTLAAHGRSRADFQIVHPPFVVAVDDEAELKRRTEMMREHVAFYGSTPAYLGVLEFHGWGDLHPELNKMSKEGRWKEMANLIDDEMLHTFAIIGKPEHAVEEIKRRFTGVVDAVSIRLPQTTEPAVSELVRRLKAA